MTLQGAIISTVLGGIGGAVSGAASNAGTSALENKSWANIAGSAVVGGIATGIGWF